MKIELADDRTGILVDGSRRDGFPHLSDASPEDQLRVARWAAKVTPEAVTPEQAELLRNRRRQRSSQRRLEGQRQDRFLASPLVRLIWQQLGDRERALVLNPDRAVGSRYPLSSGQLADLVGMSKRQVQYWSERGLLPHWLDERGHRRFEAPAAVVAFALGDSKQHDRQHYADIIASAQPLAKLRRDLNVAGLSAVVAERDPAELIATAANLRKLADALEGLQGLGTLGTFVSALGLSDAMQVQEDARHLVPATEGRWAVIARGDRDRHIFDSKDAAVEHARQALRTGGGEIVFHDEAGRVRGVDAVAAGTGKRPQRK
jgi:hypothetical protein